MQSHTLFVGAQGWAGIHVGPWCFLRTQIHLRKDHKCFNKQVNNQPVTPAPSHWLPRVQKQTACEAPPCVPLGLKSRLSSFSAVSFCVSSNSCLKRSSEKRCQLSGCWRPEFFFALNNFKLPYFSTSWTFDLPYWCRSIRWNFERFPAYCLSSSVCTPSKGSVAPVRVDVLANEDCSDEASVLDHDVAVRRAEQCCKTDATKCGLWPFLMQQSYYFFWSFFKVVQLSLMIIPVIVLTFIWLCTAGLSRLFNSKTVGENKGLLKAHFLETCLEWLETFSFDTLWEYIYWAVKNAGPTYVKLVQWIGTRTDIFPPTVCFRCARFHCDAPAHPYAYTEQTLIRAKLTNGHDASLWIDPIPVGVGCVGQVYRGVLQERSDVYHRVAVKVVHPGIRDAMSLGEFCSSIYNAISLHCCELVDLALIRFVAGFLDRLPGFSWLAIRSSAEQFSQLMFSQLDMLHEAENLVKFRRNFSTKQSQRRLAKHKSRVVVPHVFSNYSTPDILIESYEEGMLLGEWMLLTALAPKLDTAPERLPARHTTAAVDRPTAQKWTSRGYFLRYLEEENVGNEMIPAQKTTTLGGTTHTDSWVAAVVDRARFCMERSYLMLRCGANVVCGIAQETVTQINRRSVSVMAEVVGLVAKNFSLLRSLRTIAPIEKPVANYRIDVGDAGLRLFLQMVFVDNFVHADLHPGNMMIRFRPLHSQSPFQQCSSASDGITSQQISQHLTDFYKVPLSPDEQTRKVTATPDHSLYPSYLFSNRVQDVDFELVLLDCGLTTSLAARDYTNLVDLLSCLCVQDGYTAGKLMVERAKRQDCRDPDGFCKQVDFLLDRYCRTALQGTKLRQVRIGEYLARMLAIACYYRVELDPSFVALILAVIVLEGVGRQLNPDLDVLACALPYLKDAALRLVTPRRQRPSADILTDA